MERLTATIIWESWRELAKILSKTVYGMSARHSCHTALERAFLRFRHDYSAINPDSGGQIAKTPYFFRGATRPFLEEMEARAGIEPTCKDLQSSA